MKPKLIITVLSLVLTCVVGIANAQSPSPSSASKPNILVIFGDDVGQTNLSAYSFGLMGYRTPNIDRIAKEGVMFTDYYAEQSCTAGRSTFHAAH
jgi:arylsulfatase